MKLLVENGTILTQNDQREIVRGSLVAEDGVITAVGPDARAPDADEVLDAAGSLVLPGLVNAHTHLPMTLLRGLGDDLPLEEWLKTRIWPAEAHLDAALVRAGADLALLESLAAGVTCVNDMYFYAEEVAHACADAGIRAAVGAVFLDFPTAEMKPEHMAAFARDFHARWRDHDLVTPSLAPHATYTCGSGTLDTVREVRGELAADGPPPLVHTHCSETRFEVQDVLETCGARPVQVLDDHGLLDDRTVLAHCGWITKAEARRIGQTGAAVAHCPVSNLKLATGGVTPLVELWDADAPTALGTDGPASNNTLSLFDTMKFAALVQKQHRWDARAAPAQRILDAATRDGARALHTGAGTLTPGAPADLCVISLDRPGLQPVHDPVSQLVYAATAQDVAATIVAGRILYERGTHRTLDAARILQRALDAAEHLAQHV